ncbi:MAG: hypothetical protein KKG33_06585 [candidate division Zixibacteria bacterium]|nr:hypothetical protein [candidate division Zixibacteria bacterium]MBU1470201.1 hypothetical protein [candidate division Zixibacteria bacterium]MBU2625210.1 hypothetical protein [candidate division Zixibacteria bacterium]
MKAKLIFSLVSLLCLGIILILLGCEGNQGPAGLTGDDGDPGDPGNDYSIPVPEDRIFSVAVFNGRGDAHNGNATVLMTSDQDADLDGNTVIMDSVEVPPIIDGIDDGENVWNVPLADIVLGRTGSRDNFIVNARMRAAYDKDYIYLQVQWDEVASDGPVPFAIGANDAYRMWTFRDTLRAQGSSTILDTVMARDAVQIDDRVSIFWFMRGRFEDIVGWETDGCGIACHADQATGMFTVIDTTRLDAWEWGSVTTNPHGYGKDAFVQSASVGGLTGYLTDDGQPVYIENVMNRTTFPTRVPIYQHKEDPNASASNPMDEWEVKGYELTNPAWLFGSTIPGAIATYPTKSAADLFARGKFVDGTWTVEFKRARDTGQSEDDLIF